MRERPILFSGPMVRAILGGTKTQTRRVVSSANSITDARWPWLDFTDAYADRGRYLHVPQSNAPADHCPECVVRVWPRIAGPDTWIDQPATRLWVRETWQYADWTEDGSPWIGYRADGQQLLRDGAEEFPWAERLTDIWAELSDPENVAVDGRAADRRWRPSIHMPRWASRLTLQVTDIRVERLQDISPKDARAEGISLRHGVEVLLRDFRALWDSINEARGYGWDANPWVWVVSFQRADQ